MSSLVKICALGLSEMGLEFSWNSGFDKSSQPSVIYRRFTLVSLDF